MDLGDFWVMYPSQLVITMADGARGARPGCVDDGFELRVRSGARAGDR